MSHEFKPKRSMFGRQHDSRKNTAPTVGFGSSDRAGSNKVFITSEHSKINYGLESPGPVYDLKSSVGKQEASKNATAPLFSFGTADRFQKSAAASSPSRSAVPGPGTYTGGSSFGRQGESSKQSSECFGFGSSTRVGAAKVYLSPEHSKNDYGMSSPGPSAYSAKSAVGKQHESKKETAPSFVFSSTERFKYDFVERAARLPGAGQYNTVGACGLQTDSKKSTLPKYSFGTSNREQRDKVYISADHEKGQFGQSSPGPALVGGNSSVGKQTASKNASASSWSFGSARRFVYNTNKVPGPGSYD
eukprot:CAMPEP_0196580630 /NCGR_PEP_ID=MMETSP1081-20130531/29738_1 /TAXON_ID=36882 /ORGANISM="Pyramimonas amylifera, Strain CCMP720" /LENGTH=302 /DNA_ID=CAMNT_0041900553 /DNA_START=204 /DNA_END=1112 /DNA_ORIENTATION=+